MTDPLDALIDQAIQRWQTQLLQLDRRNKLLYMKQDRGSVSISPAGSIDEFVASLSRARRGLSFLYASRRAGNEVFELPGDITTLVPSLELQRRLKTLRARDREFTEEQGVNVLFLAAGFLEWVDDDGERGNAPLLLFPVDLMVASPRDPFYLVREDEDPVVNATLKHVLGKGGIQLPEYGADMTVAGYLEAVRRLVRLHPEWAVVPSLHLATFQYSKVAMWEDLEQLRSEGMSHPLARRLAGEPITQNEPEHPEPRVTSEALRGGGLDDTVDVKLQFLVLPADASQVQAAETARHGGHLVIHGPPGTGKSQTIANLISMFIADGKRVLFVSEKTAALDVVKRRLDEAGLGVFCLDLHSERGKKGNVYAQLRASLEARREDKPSGFRHAELLQQRNTLNQLTRLLHVQREPLGLSVFQVLGRYTRLQDVPDVAFAVPQPLDLSDEALSGLRAAAREVASFTEEFREHATSPFRLLKPASDYFSLENRVRSAVSRADIAVRGFREEITALTGRLGLPSPHSPLEVEDMIQQLEHLAGTPGVPVAWLEPRTAGKLRELATRRQADHLRRNDCLDSLRAAFGDVEPSSINFDAVPNAALKLRQDEASALSELLGQDWSHRLVHEGQALAHASDLLPAAAAAAEESFDRVRSALGIPMHPRRSEADRLLTATRAILNSVPLPTPWLQEGMLEWRIDGLVRDAQEALNRLVAAEDVLNAGYDRGLVDRVDEPMLIRFRSDHRSFLRHFRGQCKADLRLIQGYSRTAAKPTVEIGTRAVELALEVKAAEREWKEYGDRAAEALGNRFRERGTDWDAVRAEISGLRALMVDRGLTLETLRNLNTLPERERLEQLRLKLEVDLAALAGTEAVLTPGGPPETAAFNALVPAVEHVRTRLSEVAAVLKLLERCALLPDDLPQLDRAVTSGRALEALESDAADRRTSLASDFGSRFQGWDTDWEELLAAIDWTDQLLALFPGKLPAAVAELAMEPFRRSETTELVGRLRAARDAYAHGVGALSEVLDTEASPWGAWSAAPFDALAELFADLRQRHGKESRWLGYQRAVASLHTIASAPLVDLVRHVTEDNTQLPEIVERRVYASWLESIYASEPLLEQFTAAGQQGRINAFRELDRALIKNAGREVRAIAFKRYPDRYLTHTNAGELGVVQGQVNRKRGHLPVRRLLARAPNVVQSLKPCFMMSPLAVSQHLERGLESERVHFDVVIFDEASQVFPEDAVPAITRAKQVIVVGDQKQLPPTSFFRKFEDDQGQFDSPERDPEDDEADGLAGRESVLDALLGVGQGVRQVYLEVHYRSHHEDLIRFSNHMFYGDRLQVFPSPERTSQVLGVRDVPVLDGRYDSGASRTNRAEAERVADLVFELMRSVPLEESIGVVALSRAQSDAIEQAIWSRRALQADVDVRFSEDHFEPFFVKNLENVQGDERDHIILSVGYGPTVATGKAPQRFGPINNDGGGDPSYGQRRLNVAVSRARRSFTVVHSILPQDIVSTSRGARTLRRFLEFAASPESAFEAEQSFDPDAVPESDFEAEVAAALRRQGYEVQHQVGTAGYRIDLAVWSEDRKRFDLGVECDGWTYHCTPAARDRDWLRQDILEQLGWRIHRVWSTAWARDPAGELERLIAAVEAARSTGSRRHGSPAPDVPEQESISGVFHRPHHHAEEDSGRRHDSGRDGARDDEDAEEDAGDGDIDLGWRRPQSHLFNLYTMTRLPRKTGELRYLTFNQLQPQLTRIIETEGPVHFEVILARLRETYGVGRVGDASRDAVHSALEKLGRAGQLKVYAALGHEFYELPNHVVVPRRHDSAQGRRDPEQISGTELRAGLLSVSSVIGSCERSELIRETWRQFGFERVSSDMQTRMESSVAWLKNHDELVETEDGLLRRTS